MFCSNIDNKQIIVSCIMYTIYLPSFNKRIYVLWIPGNLHLESFVAVGMDTPYVDTLILQTIICEVNCNISHSLGQ